MTLLACGKNQNYWHRWYTRKKRAACGSIDEWHEPVIKDFDDLTPKELEDIKLCKGCFIRSDRIEMLGYDPLQVQEVRWYDVTVYRPERMIGGIKVQAPDPMTAKLLALRRIKKMTFNPRSDRKYIPLTSEEIKGMDEKLPKATWPAVKK